MSANRQAEAGGPGTCLACRGTGHLISGLGGEPHQVTCPWCRGTGSRIPGGGTGRRGGPTWPRRVMADLVGTQKYGLRDVRDVLERASAREPAARVAGGAVARASLAAVGVYVYSHVIQITSVTAPRRDD